MSWRWTGNHGAPGRRQPRTTASGAGPGEAIFEVNDGGTVGLYDFDNHTGTARRAWNWIGNHGDGPSAVAAANAAGAGPGEAVCAVNDAGTVGLYLLR